jgi:hypothetical protein
MLQEGKTRFKINRQEDETTYLEGKRPHWLCQAKRMDAIRIMRREFDVNCEREDPGQDVIARLLEDMKTGKRLQEMTKEEHCMRTGETGDFTIH